MSNHLEHTFPRLRTAGYQISSPATPEYNCVAWAASDTDRWWWPFAGPYAFWPQGAPLEETLDAFVQAFAMIGFSPCETGDLEQGYEKVAIFVGRDRRPKHVARQLPNGQWTSKLGEAEDITHALDGLENSEYGSVAKIMKRPRSSG